MGATEPNYRDPLVSVSSLDSRRIFDAPIVEKRMFLFQSASHVRRRQLSSWCISWRKRAFDVFCVLMALPVLIPMFVILGGIVRLTSRGPVFFLQKRVGRFGRSFTIFKFRTLTHQKEKGHNAVTTATNQQFTPVGKFLRRWKLDELPQLINVLLGTMSLVGPRPKLPSHQVARMACRPGITGAATIAFAREEALLAPIPKETLNQYYQSVVLPAKHWLDVRYASHATFASDFKLIVFSVLRQWDSSEIEKLIFGEEIVASVRQFDREVATDNHLSTLLESFAELKRN